MLHTCILLMILSWRQPGDTIGSVATLDVEFPSPFMIDLPKPLNICNRPVMLVPQIDLSSFVKEASSANRIFQKKLLLFCNWWISDLQTYTWALKSLPCISWCSDRWYRWNLWWCKIQITLEWLIPEAHEMCQVLICGVFAADTRIAALFPSCVTGLLWWQFVVFQLTVAEGFRQILLIVWGDIIFWSGYVSYSCCAPTAILLYLL
jgi:hypothetical protein